MKKIGFLWGHRNSLRCTAENRLADTFMVKPTIHINGTSAESLLYAYRDAADAVQDALHKLYETAPNARDDYPQGDGALSQATAEHNARIEKLMDVANELTELAMHADGFVPERV
jgi:hypothetical protein